MRKIESCYSFHTLEDGEQPNKGICIRCSRGLVTVSADRRTVGSVLCGCAGIVLVCTGVKALALPNLICILAAVLGSVAAYAVILLGMKNPLVLEYLEKAKQKFRKTS